MEWEAAERRWKNFIWLTTDDDDEKILNKKYVKDCFIYFLSLSLFRSAVVHSLWILRHNMKEEVARQDINDLKWILREWKFNEFKFLILNFFKPGPTKFSPSTTQIEIDENFHSSSNFSSLQFTSQQLNFSSSSFKFSIFS